MRRRTIQRWLIWLLPLLLLRAFVPAGFMVSYGAQGWQLVACGGISVQPSAHAQHEPQQHEHHEHAHHAGGQQEPPQSEAPQSETSSDHSHLAACPFSLVSSASVAAIPSIATDVLVPSDEPLRLGVAAAGSGAIVSAHLIRGPPQLS